MTYYCEIKYNADSFPFKVSFFVLGDSSSRKRWMKASARLAIVWVERRERRTMEKRERGWGRRRWSTWLGGVFLVPGFRLLGREARGSFCSPRRRIRRPTLSPTTRSTPIPPPSPSFYLSSTRVLSYCSPRCAPVSTPTSSPYPSHVTQSYGWSRIGGASSSV